VVNKYCGIMMLIIMIAMELSAFRRPLRGKEIEAFDSLMNKAREHASSCTVAPLLEPMRGVCGSWEVGDLCGHEGAGFLRAPHFHKFSAINIRRFRKKRTADERR
jgi:hypothetical protein